MKISRVPGANLTRFPARIPANWREYPGFAGRLAGLGVASMPVAKFGLQLASINPGATLPKQPGYRAVRAENADEAPRRRISRRRFSS